MVDEKALKIQTLLQEQLGPYAAMSKRYKKLAWFAAVRAIKLATKFGISPVTNLSVIAMAVQMRIEGHYKEASEYAELSLKLSERFPHKLGSNHGFARAYATIGVFCSVSSFDVCTVLESD